MKRTFLSCLLLLLCPMLRAQGPSVTINGVPVDLTKNVVVVQGYTIQVGSALVPPPPPPVVTLPVISTFMAVPASITAGQSAVLNFSTSGQTSLAISGVSGTPVTGMDVSPTVTTTYVLTATNSAGAATASVTVTVNPIVIVPPPPPPPVICTGSALSAPGAITKTGSYYLSGPIAGSLEIEAANVTVDLCGQTITYSAMPAFIGCNSGGKIFPALTQVCSNTGSFNGVHLTNSRFPVGGIAQASSSPVGIAAVYFGTENSYGAKPTPGVIDHLTIAVSQPAAQAIRLPYAGSGWTVEYNVVNSTIANIQLSSSETPFSARARYGGYMIWEGGGGNIAGTGDLFEYNVINGAPQGGIVGNNQNTKYLDNSCTMNSHYSNDYCVLSPTDNSEVGFNTASIMPGATVANGGRAFDAEGVNNNVHDNTADVWEGNGNTEYSGCELDGGYGLRSKFNPQVNGGKVSGTFTNNKITVEAKYCPAVAFEMTGLPATSSIIFNINTLTTVPGPGGIDAPIGFDATQAPITGSGNILKGSYGVYVNWDGAVETIPAGQAWTIGTALINDQDGGAASAANFTVPMSLSITDNPSNQTVVCGASAKGVNSVNGKIVKTC